VLYNINMAARRDTKKSVIENDHDDHSIHEPCRDA
jgi:hypothetical protein